MALHPGSLSEAYTALQEHGFTAGTMRNACERAAYSGSFTLGRVTVTFDQEAGYQVVTARPLPRTADSIVTAITEAPTEADALASLAGVSRRLLDEVADLVYVDPYGRSSAVVRRAIVTEARA